jgi:putative nucleotidyltransferase with HDIG domain
VKSENIVKFAILVVTVALSWVALVAGTGDSGSELTVGAIADQTYRSTREDTVLNQASYEGAQNDAAEAIPPVLRRDTETEEDIITRIGDLFRRVTDGVIEEQLVPVPSANIDPQVGSTTTATTVPTTTSSTAAGDASTTTSTSEPIPPELVRIVGFVYLDADADATFLEEPTNSLSDRPYQGLTWVAVSEADGTVVRSQTDAAGRFTFEVGAGTWEVGLDPSDSGLPDTVTITTSSPVQVIDCTEGQECETQPVGIGPRFRTMEQQTQSLISAYPTLQPDTSGTLVRIATNDVKRRLLGIQTVLPQLLEETLGAIGIQFGQRINNQAELATIQAEIYSSPPLVFVDGVIDEPARQAVADLVASFLVVNTETDEQQTSEARQTARAEVDATLFEQRFSVGQVIVEEGDPLTQFVIDAISQVGPGNALPVRAPSAGLMLVVLIGIVAYYLSKFRSQFWHAPRMVALLGLLIVLGAASVRLAAEFEEQTSWFILPAVAFGYLAAVLFDNRMGTIMALTLGVLAAIGTRDTGVTVYALLATLAPIGFVSRVSSRRSFRNSVITSAFASGLIGGAIAWMFFPAQSTLDTMADAWTNVGTPMAWAFGTGLVASLVALSIMPFFESAFDITTTLRLLELTDRNHEALQILQEKAFGTFNHSLMVGTLADAAARAIGANNLLARAAAYYHDLGKTENPMYFIENQFGSVNPHDELPPEQSAQIIRSHVIDGMALAEKHKIPSEVSEGILAHHGDAIMRFFYEKARQQYGDENVDVDDYRHAGHKPTSREMAIVMMADSVEGACRAVFGDEEPTPEGIEKVVNRIVDEKVSDGQLGACDLTLGELTQVKGAFIEALVGHYHQRIPYPNFPGS